MHGGSQTGVHGGAQRHVVECTEVCMEGCTGVHRGVYGEVHEGVPLATNYLMGDIRDFEL